MVWADQGWVGVSWAGVEEGGGDGTVEIGETGRREGAIFVAVARAEVIMETDKCHLELPRPTARPGTSQSLMKDFAVKTRNFYK